VLSIIAASQETAENPNKNFFLIFHLTVADGAAQTTLDI
jgi:hypothetical protein